MVGHFVCQSSRSIWMARTAGKFFSTWCPCSFSPFLPWCLLAPACSPWLPLSLPYVFPFWLTPLLLTNECQSPGAFFGVLNGLNPFLHPSPYPCCPTSWPSCLLPVLQHSAPKAPCAASASSPCSSHSLYPINSLLALNNIYTYLKIELFVHSLSCPPPSLESS